MQQDKQQQTDNPLVEALTPRERDVMRLLAQHLRYQDIADQLTMALSSVKWYANQIYGKLGVDNRRDAIQRAQALGLLETRLPASGLSQDNPSPAAVIQHPNNLPEQVSSFIGREKEIAEVAGLMQTHPLQGHRLVTLYGSGGVGKTRMALEVARRLLGAFDHGAWLVELAPLSDPSLVATTVACIFHLREASGAPVEEMLSSYLREKSLLLVLDNCEHLVEPCAWLVERILRAAPRVKVLVTSREVFGINGEVAYRVPSLSLPLQADLGELAQSEAGRLFAERAAAALPGFHLTPANTRAVAQICTRLDGIPLAIELAASRVRVMGAEQLAARLDDRFRLLTGGSRTALPRQQTLLATIDWSYSLLSEPERVLLRRLSVFSGGWALEAAEEVCADKTLDHYYLNRYQVLDGLASLVNKSLVLMDASDDVEPRYRLLETVRQYACERLSETHDGPALRDRHLAYFTGWAEQAYDGLYSSRQKYWLARGHQELDNLRSGLEWGAAHDRMAGLRLAMAASRYFRTTNRYQEAERWLALYLDLPDAGYPLALQAEALARAGHAILYVNMDLAEEYARRAIALTALQQEESITPALAYYILGLIAWQNGDAQTYPALMAEARRLAQAQHTDYVHGFVLEILGRQAMEDGSPEAAHRYFQEFLDISIASDNLSDIAYAKHWLGALNASAGDLAGGRRMLEEAVQVWKDLGTAIHSDRLGWVALQQGDYPAALASFIEFTESWRDAGRMTGVVGGMCQQAVVLFYTGDTGRAAALLVEAQQLLDQQTKDEGSEKFFRSLISGISGWVATWSGEYEQAEAQFAALEARPIERSFCVYRSYHSELCIRQGRLNQAAGLLRQALEFSVANGARLEVHDTLEPGADLFFHQGQAEIAARLCGASEAFRRQAGRPRPPQFAPYYEALREKLRARLGEEGFRRAYAEGQSLSLDAAAALLETLIKHGME